MRQKSTGFVTVMKIVLAVCILGIIVNGKKRSNLGREMGPYLREYQTMNSASYQGALFLEGLVNGYNHDGPAIANSIRREYLRGTHVEGNLKDLSAKWSAAHRDLRLSIWGAVISGILLLGYKILKPENQPVPPSSSTDP